jgi:hypothetical protein
MELESTIAISRNTRDMLKELGRKGQTYDHLINELIKSKVKRNKDRNQDLLDRNGIGTPNGQTNPSVHKRGNPLA